MHDETLDFLAELEQTHDETVDNDHLTPSGERPCPICGETMGVEFNYGMSIDVCEQHGIWLDRGELRKVVSFVKSGERISRQDAIRNAKRQGKISGTVFGAWSLMFD